MNTIGGMQNEMEYYGQCNNFEYNNDFVKVSVEIFYDTLGYVFLYNNVCLFDYMF